MPQDVADVPEAVEGQDQQRQGLLGAGGLGEPAAEAVQQEEAIREAR